MYAMLTREESRERGQNTDDPKRASKDQNAQPVDKRAESRAQAEERAKPKEKEQRAAAEEENNKQVNEEDQCMLEAVLREDDMREKLEGSTTSTATPTTTAPSSVALSSVSAQESDLSVVLQNQYHMQQEQIQQKKNFMELKNTVTEMSSKFDRVLVQLEKVTLFGQGEEKGAKKSPPKSTRR